MLRKTYLHVLATIIVLPFFLHLDCRLGQSHPQEISTAELQALMASGQDFALINVLPKIIYDSKHLPGSVNLPIGTLEELSILPYPKDLPIIFYCMGYL